MVDERPHARRAPHPGLRGWKYIWQPSLAEAQPEAPFSASPWSKPSTCPMSRTHPGEAVPIIFGDIATGYRIVDRTALSVLVNPYIRATEGITRIHATRRVGAGVVQPKSIASSNW